MSENDPDEGGRDICDENSDINGIVCLLLCHVSLNLPAYAALACHILN